ncbi:hypothetical protein [Lacticaseibacillus salsurivasis]|uniref:hypothetical protein n=1 Tax=Lacticaseibacillus salsurivasis TaxID=3081441 RepID=UPI0030C77D02
MAEQPKPASSRKRNLIVIAVIALLVAGASTYGLWSSAKSKREAAVSESVGFFHRYQNYLITKVTIDGKKQPALTLYPRTIDYDDFSLEDMGDTAPLIKMAKQGTKNVEPGTKQAQQVQANNKLAHDVANLTTLQSLDPEYLKEGTVYLFTDENPGDGTKFVNHVIKLGDKMIAALGKMKWQTNEGRNFATSELAYVKAAVALMQELKQNYPEALDALVIDDALVNLDATTREEIAAKYKQVNKVGGASKHAYIFAEMPSRLTGEDYDYAVEQADQAAEDAAEDSVPDEDDSAPMLESGNIGSRDILDHTTVSWVENDSGNYDVWLDNASDTSFNLAKEAIVLSQSSEDWSVRLVNFDGDADDFRALHVLPIGDTTNDGWSWSKLYCPAGYQRRIITNVSSDTFDKFSDGYVLYEFPQSGTSYMTLGKLEMSDD